MSKRALIRVSGIVQGVGFRPFVFKLAGGLKIVGTIKNNAFGVEIDAQGNKEDLNNFISSIKNDPPPLAYIEQLDVQYFEPEEFAEFTEFRIIESEKSTSHSVYISPDVAICSDCLFEMKNPEDRRFGYPFTNCTNCGPRFTITQDIPYDRKNTVMKKFELCTKCYAEYTNPLDRRFHAQPISCFDCGPTLTLKDNNGAVIDIPDTRLLEEVRNLLKAGNIIAIKGLGGYHLACNAQNVESVRTLRMRKNRDGKPFALMANNINTVNKHCIVSKKEEEILTGIKKPIILLEKREPCSLSIDLSCDNGYLGIMLPYTPLHLLLFDDNLDLLVMTSGNIAGEPIYYEDTLALDGLSHIADYFLTNNRDIHIRTDDSVTSVIEGAEYIIRRSRGYVPYPLKIPVPKDFDKELMPTILSCGSELKNNFCISKKNSAFLSHHIGDLENSQSLESFEDGISHFCKILNVEPQIFVCDMHPDYLSTQYAQKETASKKLPILYVQHHHAHIASCMAENALQEKVIGVVFDGSGYGEDGNIWGGEFFSGDYNGFRREAHFSYVQLPGGEMAIKEPWRMAISYLFNIYGGEILASHLDFIKSLDAYKLDILIQQLQKNINTPLSSSAGRLFDGVSSLLGLCNKISYEGQAAILLEKIARKDISDSYPMELAELDGLTAIEWDKEPIQISIKKLFNFVISDIMNKIDIGIISAKFHNTLALIIADISNAIRIRTEINTVILSGGVFQNRLLLQLASKSLKDLDFNVYTHSLVPTNDGGISFGQTAIAMFKK